MKVSFLQLPFYFGLSVYLVGVLFRIQHYPGGMLCIDAGLLLEAIFCLLVLVEIIFSKKAGVAAKILWSLGYTLSPLIAVFFLPMLIMAGLLFFWGNTYLQGGRKVFLFRRSEAEKIPFDSI